MIKLIFLTVLYPFDKRDTMATAAAAALAQRIREAFEAELPAPLPLPAGSAQLPVLVRGLRNQMVGHPPRKARLLAAGVGHLLPPLLDLALALPDVPDAEDLAHATLSMALTVVRAPWMPDTDVLDHLLTTVPARFGLHHPLGAAALRVLAFLASDDAAALAPFLASRTPILQQHMDHTAEQLASLGRANTAVLPVAAHLVALVGALNVAAAPAGVLNSSCRLIAVSVRATIAAAAAPDIPTPQAAVASMLALLHRILTVAPPDVPQPSVLPPLLPLLWDALPAQEPRLSSAAAGWSALCLHAASPPRCPVGALPPFFFWLPGPPGPVRSPPGCGIRSVHRASLWPPPPLSFPPPALCRRNAGRWLTTRKSSSGCCHA